MLRSDRPTGEYADGKVRRRLAGNSWAQRIESQAMCAMRQYIIARPRDISLHGLDRPICTSLLAGSAASTKERNLFITIGYGWNC